MAGERSRKRWMTKYGTVSHLKRPDGKTECGLDIEREAGKLDSKVHCGGCPTARRNRLRRNHPTARI